MLYMIDGTLAICEYRMALVRLEFHKIIGIYYIRMRHKKYCTIQVLKSHKHHQIFPRLRSLRIEQFLKERGEDNNFTCFFI